MKMYRLIEILQEMIEEEKAYLKTSDAINDPIYFEATERKEALELSLEAFQRACAAHNTKTDAINNTVKAKIFDFMEEKKKKG